MLFNILQSLKNCDDVEYFFQVCLMFLMLLHSFNCKQRSLNFYTSMELFYKKKAFEVCRSENSFSTKKLMKNRLNEFFSIFCILQPPIVQMVHVSIFTKCALFHYAYKKTQFIFCIIIYVVNLLLLHIKIFFGVNYL